MKVKFNSASQRELADAVTYYESQQVGLGLRFLVEVDGAVDRIRENPDTWARISSRLRRCLVHRFPFGLYYHTTGDEIQIVAVADLRRDPNRWEDLI